MADGLELSVTRLIQAPPEILWRVWTERLEQWWCPRPWTSRIRTLDLRPGGGFHVEMRGPDGQVEDVPGVFLEIEPHRSIVFTDAFRPGWIPAEPFMLGFFRFDPEGSATRYTAGARHWSEQARRAHEEMGFHQGWTAVAEQFAALAEAEAQPA